MPELVYVQDLELPSHMFVMSLVFNRQDELLIIGTRAGCIAIYDTSSSGPRCGKKLSTVVVYRRVHGYNAVTSFLVEKLEKNCWIVNSVGRDGCFSKCTLRKNLDFSSIQPQLEKCESGWNFERTHQSKITSGWLSKISSAGEDLIFSGFYDAKFFLYNQTKHYKIFDIKCGGGHRIWDFKAKELDLTDAVFGYIKNDSLNLVKNPLKNSGFINPILKESYHGLETRAVTVTEFLKEKLIISGGEDGVLSFHTYTAPLNNNCESFNIGTLNRLDTCRKHFASIRCLHLTQSIDGKDTLLFSGGSRQVIKCWKITKNNSHFQCVDLSTAAVVTELIETRVMDISSINRKDHHLVATACSDGVIRV